MFLALLSSLTYACTNDANEEVTNETETSAQGLAEDDMTLLHEEQDVNVELEQLDGELDSLLNSF